MKRFRRAFVVGVALVLATLSGGSAAAEQTEEACSYELCLYSGLFYLGSMEAPNHPGASWCRPTFITSVRSYENLGNRRFTLYTNGDCTGASDEIYPGESAPVSGVVGRSLWYCPAC